MNFKFRLRQKLVERTLECPCACRTCRFSICVFGFLCLLVYLDSFESNVRLCRNLRLCNGTPPFCEGSSSRPRFPTGPIVKLNAPTRVVGKPHKYMCKSVMDEGPKPMFFPIFTRVVRVSFQSASPVDSR